jgi:N-acetylglucosamine kinase-like BadF-type ATPase
VLRAVVRALDGRGARTLLQELLFEELGVSSIEELIPRVYEGPMPKEQIAALASLVETARAQGDVIASGILQQGAEELCLAARSVALQLSLRDAFTVVLAGGVFKACPTLARAMEGTLQIPGARLRVLDVEPAYGAVLLARELLKAGEA